MRHHTVPLSTRLPARRLPVFRSGDFRVIEGVNEGDPLSDARDLLHEDVYALTERARPVRLEVVGGAGTATQTGLLSVGRDSAAGKPGAPVYLDSLLTFMEPAGRTHDALVFVEVDTKGLIAEVYLHPLAPLVCNQSYVLVTIDRAGAAARLAGAGQSAVTPGPRSPTANGGRRPVEGLRSGEKASIRGSGPQALRPI